MDCIVHEVAKSQTRLSDFHFHMKRDERRKKKDVNDKKKKVKVKLLSRVRLFATLWMVGSLPGSSVHGILQIRILEWVASPFSRGSSHPRDRTQVSCIAGRFFTAEPLGRPENQLTIE